MLACFGHPARLSFIASLGSLRCWSSVTQGEGSLLGLLAEVLGGNAVHVHDALLGKRLAHGHGLALLLGSVLDLANNTGSLELLKAVADVLTGGHSGFLLLGATVGLGSEVLAEALDTGLLAHVKLVADGGSTDEKPVVVIRGQLLVAGGLNSLGPLYNIILIRTRIGNKSEAHKTLRRLNALFFSGMLVFHTYIRDLELVKLLQMLSEYLDEFGRGYVFHSVYVSVEKRKVLLHDSDNGHVRHSQKGLTSIFSSTMRFLLNNRAIGDFALESKVPTY